MAGILGLNGRSRTARSITFFNLDANCGESIFQNQNNALSAFLINISATLSKDNSGNWNHVNCVIEIGYQGGVFLDQFTIPLATYQSGGILTITTVAEQAWSFGTDPISLKVTAKIFEYARQPITYQIEWNGTRTHVAPAEIGLQAAPWLYTLGGSLLVTPASDIFADALHPPPGGTLHSWIHPQSPYSISAPFDVAGADTITDAFGVTHPVGSHSLSLDNGVDIQVTSAPVFAARNLGSGLFNSWYSNRAATLRLDQSKASYALRGRMLCFDDFSGLNPRTFVQGVLPNTNAFTNLDGDSPSLDFTQATTDSDQIAAIVGYQKVFITPDTATILARSGDNFQDSLQEEDHLGRILDWPVFTLTHAKTLSLPTGAWQPIGGANIAADTITPAGSDSGGKYALSPKFNMSGYRFLRFNASAASATGGTATLKINQKTWLVAIPPGLGVVEIDLCAPTNGGTDVLGQDSSWPAIQIGGIWQPQRESDHWGINFTDGLSFTGLSSAITITGFELFRKGNWIYEGLTEYEHSSTIAVAPDGHTPLGSAIRNMLGIVDGRLSLEWPSEYTFPAHPIAPNSNFIDYANTIPGWTAALLPDVSFYAVENDPIWKSINNIERAMRGAYYNHTMGEFIGTSRESVDSTYTGHVNLPFQVLDVHPGCGDPMTGVGYGSGACIAAFIGLLRGKTWGIAFDGASPASGLQIDTFQHDTGEFAGSGVSDSIGYWESGPPYARHGKFVDVKVDGKVQATVGIVGRRRSRILPKGSGKGCAIGFGPIRRNSPGFGPLSYMVAFIGKSGLSVAISRHPDIIPDKQILLTTNADISNVRISQEGNEAITVTYVRNETLYRQQSFSFGDDWSDPEALVAGVKRARIVTTSADETCILVKGTDLSIKAAIYDRTGTIIGIFPNDATGMIGGMPWDDTDFDAVAVPGSDNAIDLIDSMNGTEQVWRSTDNGREWIHRFDLPS